MENQELRQIRRRVNASKSVKGIVTWDVTVEVIEPLNESTMSHGENQFVLMLHDDLVAKLESRYPTKEE